MQDGAKRYLLVAVVIAAVISYFSAQFNRYYLGIVIDIGINIILAVSLNLINGHTGQFSLGHAGFMAVGAYTAASLTFAMGAARSSPFVAEIIFAARTAHGWRGGGGGRFGRRHSHVAFAR